MLSWSNHLTNTQTATWIFEVHLTLSLVIKIHVNQIWPHIWLITWSNFSNWTQRKCWIVADEHNFPKQRFLSMDGIRWSVILSANHCRGNGAPSNLSITEYVLSILLFNKQIWTTYFSATLVVNWSEFCDSLIVYFSNWLHVFGGVIFKDAHFLSLSSYWPFKHIANLATKLVLQYWVSTFLTKEEFCHVHNKFVGRYQTGEKCHFHIIFVPISHSLFIVLRILIKLAKFTHRRRKAILFWFQRFFLVYFIQFDPNKLK